MRMNPSSSGTSQRALAEYVLAAFLFGCVTLLWVWALARYPSRVVPGAGAGDNLTFVWNLWATRQALTHPGTSPLFTSLLFHPFGVDLTLHTNTLLPAAAVSTIADPVVAQNVLIIAHIFLNFLCAYAMARRETHDPRAGFLAAVLFGYSPFLAAHLLGHFNLIAAWVLPLAALAALRLRERPSTPRGLALGVVLGACAYVDYYYFVYAAGLAGALLSADAFAWTRVSPPEAVPLGLLIRTLVALLALDLLVLLWVLTTGGGQLNAAGARMSIRGAGNPVAVAWLLSLLIAVMMVMRRHRLHVRLAGLRILVVPALAAGAVLLTAITPLLWHAVRLWRSGDYATQQYLWRSAPPGIDLLSLMLGNPFSAVYGPLSAAGYERFGVNMVESVGWLTPAMLVLAVFGVRASRAHDERPAWTVPFVIFALWALGPYIYVAAHATTLWLPAVLVRWIPAVNNARIPARAIVVVYLLLAVLAAKGFAYLLHDRRKAALGWSLAALAVIDLIPQRPPLYRIERPALYETLRSQPPGAVCELPFGLRDGFGEIGRLDARSMFFQTIHEHPMVGGFVARLPKSLPARYDALPIVGTLLRLSGGAPLPTALPAREEAGRTLTRMGIRYVVLNHRTSPPDLLTYVERVLPLDAIAQEEERTLFVVRSSGS